MKKFLSVLLSVIMVFAVFAAALPAVSAADAGSSDLTEDSGTTMTSSFRIGSTYYDTLKNAVGAATDGSVIEMLKDYTLNDDEIMEIPVYRGLTLEGNGHTLYALNNNVSYVFNIRNEASVVIRNLTMFAQSGIELYNGSLTLENCEINTFWRVAVKADSAIFADIKVYNSTLRTYDPRIVSYCKADQSIEASKIGTDPVVLLNPTTNGKVSFKTYGSGTRLIRENRLNSAGNSAIINMPNTNNQYTNNEVKAVIGGGTQLINRSLPSADETIKTARFIYTENKHTTTSVVFESGSVLVNEVGTGVTLENVGGNANAIALVDVSKATSVVVSSNTANKVLYYNGSAYTTTDNLRTAITSAAANTAAGDDVIYISLLDDYAIADMHVLATASGYYSFSSKDYVFCGNGFSLELLKCYNASGSESNRNMFPFTVNNGSHTVFKDFESVSTDGGGILSENNGTLTLDGVRSLSATGRACVKNSAAGTNVINVKNSKIQTLTTTADTEAPVIFDGTNYGILNLYEGAEIWRNNKTDAASEAQASAIYTSAQVLGGEINMYSGSRVFVNYSNLNKNSNAINNLSSENTLAVNIEKGAHIIMNKQIPASITFGFFKGKVKLDIHETALLAIDNLLADANTSKLGSSTTPEGVTLTYGYVRGSYTAASPQTATVDGNTYDVIHVQNAFTYTKGGAAANTNRLQYAINNADADSTITLNMGYAVNEKGLTYNSSDKDNITLDLNGYKYTAWTANVASTENAGGWYWFSSIKRNLTIRNGTLALSAGPNVQENGHVTLNGVDMYAVEAYDRFGGLYVRPMLRLDAVDVTETEGLTVNATIIDSTIKQTSTGELTILVPTASGSTNPHTVINIDIQNSTVINESKVNDHPLNSSVIGVYEDNRKTVINIDGTSRIISRHRTVGNENYVSSCIFTASANDVTLNLAAGAILEIDRGKGSEDLSAKSSFIGYGFADDAKPCIVYDSGAIYKINKEALGASNGVLLPTDIHGADDTEKLIGFVGSDGNLHKELYADFGATEDMTFTALTYKPGEDFGMMDGAAVRTAANEDSGYNQIGIRYTSFVSDELKDVIDQFGAKYGTIIAPAYTDYDDPKNNSSLININCTKIVQDKTIGGNTYDNVFYAAVIKSSNASNEQMYRLTLGATSYFTVTYIDGDTETFYTDFGDENVRSMHEVVHNLNKNAANADYIANNEVLKDILKKTPSKSVVRFDVDGAVKLVYASNAYVGADEIANTISTTFDGVTVNKTALADNTYNAEDIEILIGDTGYAESVKVKNTLKDGEFSIKMVGNKLVVVGSNDAALSEAIVTLIANLKTTRFTNDEGISVIANYAYKAFVGSREAETELEKLLVGFPTIEGFDVSGATEVNKSYIVELDTAEFDALNAAMAEKLTSRSEYVVGETVYSKVYYTEKLVITMLKTTLDASITDRNGVCKMIIESRDYTTLPVTEAEDAALGLAQSGNVTITQIGLAYDKIGEDGEVDQLAKDYINGMSYVIKLPDGRFIILDGGHDNDINATSIYGTLEKQADDPDNIVVAAWIFSHTDGDHVDAFAHFANIHAENVTIESFIYNFGTAASNVPVTEFSMIEAAPDANRIIAHTGQEFYFGGAKLTVLYTGDAYGGEINNSATVFSDVNNNSSVVFKLEHNGKSFLSFGDYSDNGRTLMGMYPVSSGVLDSDIVQVAHHGISGMSNDMYATFVTPDYALWPVGTYKDELYNPNKEKSDIYNLAQNAYINNLRLNGKAYVAQDNVHVATLDTEIKVVPYETVSEYLGYTITTSTGKASISLELPTSIYSNYAAKPIEVVYKGKINPDGVTYTTSDNRVVVEDGKIYATGNFGEEKITVTVTATCDGASTSKTLVVSSYQGSTHAGNSLNIETNHIPRIEGLIDTNSQGASTDGCTLWVGDSFFNTVTWWDKFYTQNPAGSNNYTVGISSSTVEDWHVVSERLVYPYNPSTIAVHIGTNDIFDDGRSASATYMLIIQLLTEYHKKLPNAKIYWFSIEPRTYALTGDKATAVKNVNSSMKNYAMNRDWLVYVDSDKWYWNDTARTEINTSAYHLNSDGTRDTVHPHDDMYAKYMAAISDEVTGIDINTFKYTSPVIYRGDKLFKEYIVEGTMTLGSGCGANPHIAFSFNHDNDRFLFWDDGRSATRDQKFGVGYRIASGSYVNESNYELFDMTGETSHSFDWKVLFTEKNAYFFINGKLEAIMFNPVVSTTQGFVITAQNVDGAVSNVHAYTKDFDHDVYMNTYRAVEVYEKANYTTSVAMRVRAHGTHADISTGVGQAMRETDVVINGALSKNYVIQGKLTISDMGDNGHVEFATSSQNPTNNRFLLIDGNNDGHLGVGYQKRGSGHVNERGYEEYILTEGEPLVFDWMVYVSETNAYLYLNGELKAIYYNAYDSVNGGNSFEIGCEKVEAKFSDIVYYTAAEFVNGMAAEVAEYEAKKVGSDPYFVRVGHIKDNVRGTGDTVGTKVIDCAVDNEYLIKGNMTLNSSISNAHVSFRFNDNYNRLLLWDTDWTGASDGKFGVGCSINNTYTTEVGYELFDLSAQAPLTLEWQLLFTEKNAYLYLDGELVAIYYNVIDPCELQLTSQGIDMSFTDMYLYTAESGSLIYQNALEEVEFYESVANETTRIVRF